MKVPRSVYLCLVAAQDKSENNLANKHPNFDKKRGYPRHMENKTKYVHLVESLWYKETKGLT
jgi:hypothetical protein